MADRGAAVDCNGAVGAAIVATGKLIFETITGVGNGFVDCTLAAVVGGALVVGGVDANVGVAFIFAGVETETTGAEVWTDGDVDAGGGETS